MQVTFVVRVSYDSKSIMLPQVQNPILSIEASVMFEFRVVRFRSWCSGFGSYVSGSRRKVPGTQRFGLTHAFCFQLQARRPDP